MKTNYMTFGFFNRTTTNPFTGVSTRPSGVSGGLRIEGRNPDEINEEKAARAAETKKSAESAGNQTFESVMADRLKEARPWDKEAAAVLAYNLKVAAARVEEDFGKQKASQFQNGILKATSKKVSEQALANAISWFFRGMAESDAEEPIKPDALAKIRDFLNFGVDVEDSGETEPGDNSESSSLAAAMNRFFGGAASKTSKRFNESFDWVRAIEPEAPVENVGIKWSEIHFGDSAASGARNFALDEQSLLDAAYWVRANAGSENAALYLEKSSAGGAAEAIATTVAIVAREAGLEPAKAFVQYLNDNVAPKVEAGALVFKGWNLGRDYSAPSQAEQASSPSEKSRIEYLWAGDDQAEKELLSKKHLGLLSNFISSDPQNGASLIIPVTQDLDEAYNKYLGLQGEAKAIDDYV